jgi:GNAT superfamily N-acetyltransferase
MLLVLGLFSARQINQADEIMKIVLQKTSIQNALEIHQMQILSFSPLLEKYQDHDLSPAAEKIFAIQDRLRDPSSDYYFITVDTIKVGAVRIVRLEKQNRCRVSPLFVLPQFQGRGIAQPALRSLETLYHPSNGWILQTIAEEAGNCYLYEKMGYVKTGVMKQIKEGMHLVNYEKHVKRGQI